MSALAEPVAPAAPPSDEGAVPAAAAAAATAAAASPPTNGAAEQPQQRVRLIRVKRKRGTDAPEDLGELGERDLELPCGFAYECCTVMPRRRRPATATQPFNSRLQAFLSRADDRLLSNSPPLQWWRGWQRPASGPTPP